MENRSPRSTSVIGATVEAVTGWTLLALLVVVVVVYGLAVAGALPSSSPSADPALLPATPSAEDASLARAAELLGIARGGVVADMTSDADALAEAGALVDQAVADVPDSAAAHRLRALHRLAAGDLEAAVDAAARAVELAPGDLGHRLVLGAAQTQARRLDEAEATFREATETWPNAVEAWHGLGQVLWLQGREDEALAAYREKLAAKNRREAS